MKPYLSVNAIRGSIYTCFVYLQITASWQNLAQLPQIMDRDTLKALLEGKGNLQVKLNLF